MSLPTPTELSEFAHTYEQLQNNPIPRKISLTPETIIIISLLLIIMFLSYTIYTLTESISSLNKQLILLQNVDPKADQNSDNKIEKLTTGDLFTMNLSTFAEPFDDNDLPSGLSYRDDFVTPHNKVTNTETFNAGS